MENKISQKQIQQFINKCKELIKVCGLINNDPDLFLNPNKEKITNVSIIRPLHDIQPFKYSNQKIKSNQLYLRIKTNKTKEYDYLLYTPYKYKHNGKIYETFKNLSVICDYDGYWFGNNYEVLVDNVDIEIDKYIFMIENDENDPDHYIAYTKYMNNDEYKDWYNKTHHITPEYIEFQKQQYEYWKSVYNDMEKYKDLDYSFLKVTNMTLEEFLDDHCDLDVINNN